MSYHSGNQLVDPKQLFEKSELRAGMHIADFGCGRTGHVVFPASLVVGEKGVVYAVDVLKEVLESVKKRAKLENVVNVHTVWADIEKSEGVSIAKKTLDIAFLINVLYHFDYYKPTLDEAARLLKDKSKIVVVDWAAKLGGMGPHENRFVDFEKIKNWARKVGFGIQDDFAAGPYHRCLILYKNG